MPINIPLKMKILEKYPFQADFAHELGVSEVEVSRVVRGRIKLDPEFRPIWARLLQCEVGDIFDH